jgi:hypothetical protein
MGTKLEHVIRFPIILREVRGVKRRRVTLSVIAPRLIWTVLF